MILIPFSEKKEQIQHNVDFLDKREIKKYCEHYSEF